MAHKFDPQKLEKLKDPKRFQIFNPNALFKELALDKFQTILDFGVGTGSGTIYAIDLQDELLAYAQEKYELNEPHQTIKDLHHLLKKAGKLLIIDWDKKERDMGPPPDEVYGEGEGLNLLKKNHFKLIQKIVKDPYVLIFLAEKE